MTRTSRLGLVAAAAILSGCRAWESYVPLTPASDAWTKEPGETQEEYVWRADGVTIRVYAEGTFGGRGSVGNTVQTPRTVTLTFVVTNEGTEPLGVTAECSGADAGAKWSGGWRRGSVLVHPQLTVIDFVHEAFEVPPRGTPDESNSQEFELGCTAPKDAPPATERHLLFDLYLRRGDTEMHCPAHFVAHGSARDLHWYTIPADVAVWTVEICAIFVMLPLTLNGAG